MTTPTELVPYEPETALTVNVENALVEWQAYQELTRKLLDDTDYQRIGNKRFKKKSAWRKYARAFRISCEVTSEEIVRDSEDHPVWARIRVRATDRSGQSQEADQEAHLLERCCPSAKGEPCRKAAWKGHYCCKRDCTGKIHWSHPGDLPATALTRAKNRAIADLIGAGEVSAEEMPDTAAVEDGEYSPLAETSPPQAGGSTASTAPHRTRPTPPVGEERPDLRPEVACVHRITKASVEALWEKMKAKGGEYAMCVCCSGAIAQGREYCVLCQPKVEEPKGDEDVDLLDSPFEQER